MHILETVNDCCLQRYSVNRPKRTNLCASFFFLFARFSKSSVFQQNLHIVRICFALWRYLYKSELQQLWRRQRKRENNKSSRVNKQNKSSQRTADGLADFWAVIAGLLTLLNLIGMAMRSSLLPLTLPFLQKLSSRLRFRRDYQYKRLLFVSA